jgi:hypothetical protein
MFAPELSWRLFVPYTLAKFAALSTARSIAAIERLVAVISAIAP